MGICPEVTLTKLTNKKGMNYSTIPNSRRLLSGFPGGAVVKNPPASAGYTGSSPGPGRSHMPRSN